MHPQVLSHNNHMPTPAKIAKPLVKWAGGKTQLIPTLYQHLPQDNITKYCEPFFGGGALFFSLTNKSKFKSAIISDCNANLINLYKVAQQHPCDLIDELEKIQLNYIPLKDTLRKEMYYKFRDIYNSRIVKKLDIKNAAIFIFLNKTCFNGLYRVNANGKFNVPQGQYKNPKIVDIENIYAVHRALQNTEILCCSFETTTESLTSEYFVYYDPPYRPISTSSSFTSYSGEFNDTHQILLANTFTTLHKKNIRQLVSNSDPYTYSKDNFFNNLYANYNIIRVTASRRINSLKNKRGCINELLIKNYG